MPENKKRMLSMHTFSSLLSAASKARYSRECSVATPWLQQRATFACCFSSHRGPARLRYACCKQYSGCRTTRQMTIIQNGSADQNALASSRRLTFSVAQSASVLGPCWLAVGSLVCAGSPGAFSLLLAARAVGAASAMGMGASARSMTRNWSLTPLFHGVVDLPLFFCEEECHSTAHQSMAAVQPTLLVQGNVVPCPVVGGVKTQRGGQEQLHHHGRKNVRN